MIAFVFFLLVVAFTGGSSRADMVSLLLLRPLSVLFFAYALFFITKDQLRLVQAPLIVLTSLLFLAILQLVPLPAQMWSSLPNRELVMEASKLVGLQGESRPLSLDPSMTWNTLFALFTPLAALLLAVMQPPDEGRGRVQLLIGVALLSAAFGIFQAIGVDGLHFYRIANEDYPTGLFANKNHQSILLLWLILALCWLTTTFPPKALGAGISVGAVFSAIIVLFPLLILTGSRAGLALSIPVLLLSLFLLLRAPKVKAFLKKASRRVRIVLGGVAALLFMLLAAFFILLMGDGRRTALSRLFQQEFAQDARWSHLPAMVEMMTDYLPFGIGFGAFAQVFKSYEATETLSPRYMNAAHNDALQLLIEGGLPAAIIALSALIWLGLRLWKVMRSESLTSQNLGLFAGGTLGLWIAASLVDYPLRTPLAAVFIVVLTVQLLVPSTAVKSGCVE